MKYQGITQLPETLKDLEEMSDLFLTAQQLGTLLHADPDKLRVAARTAPEKFGIAAVCWGNEVRFPRPALISYLRYGRAVVILGNTDRVNI